MDTRTSPGEGVGITLSALLTIAVVLAGTDLGWRIRRPQTTMIKDNKIARAVHAYSLEILSSVWERTPGDISVASFGARELSIWKSLSKSVCVADYR